jgi:hypothetical protein
MLARRAAQQRSAGGAARHGAGNAARHARCAGKLVYSTGRAGVCVRRASRDHHAALLHKCRPRRMDAAQLVRPADGRSNVRRALAGIGHSSPHERPAHRHA